MKEGDSLIAKLRELIQGEFVDRVEVIKSAEAGNLLAHEALMAEWEEAFDNNRDMPATLKSYVLRCRREGEVKRGRGHTEWDNVNRDVGVFLMAKFISRTFGIDLTRSEATDRACAASVLAKALKRSRSGIDLKEKRIAGIITSQGKWFNKLFTALPNLGPTQGVRP
jgi:hypothetical protein